MHSFQKNGEKNKAGFFTSLIRNSLILSALDKFTSYIYYLLKNGFFGYLFTGYKSNLKSTIVEKIGASKFGSHEREFRYGMCRRIESSVIIGGVSYVMKFLLGCRLKVYGAFLSSFGLYTAIISFIRASVENNLAGLPEDKSVITAVIMIISSIPLIMSKKRLNEALVSSNVGGFILKICGYGKTELDEVKGDGGYVNTAFFVGIIFGALTYYVSPVILLVFICAVIWAYLVLVRPEIGVLSLFFLVPWMPTMLLAAIVIYTSLCYLIKLFRGKRIFRIEPVDIMAAAFALMLFFGGVISLSQTSLKPALLMLCLIFGYFLTVELITSREWLVKCSVACVTSAVLESLYALYLYFTGGGYSSKAWVDDEMFASIGARAVGSLDNPNMLGEYLILIIPIAAVMLIGRGEGLRRFSALLSLGIMGSCLILTWSRGAWLGLILAFVVLLFMWHRRSLWLVFAGILSLPLLTSFLPQSIIYRFTSIGNLSDSSTSYRVYIWHSAVKMIKDNFVSGIGIGEGAWDRLYPLYTYMGVEAAPHSHNLYLQIWLELGVFGIAVFVIFIFLLFSSAFTLFYALSDKSVNLKTELSADMLKYKLLDGGEDTQTSVKQSKIQLRLSSAGPLCGIFAVLVQGMTDYAWYNYRLYLMFWLVCGLAAAYIRNGQSMLENGCSTLNDSNSCYKEIALNSSAKKRRKSKDSTGGTK